jgi:hypothetical protein
MISKLERNERLQKCVAGSQVYTVTRRREYGISSTSTSTIKKAKHFTGQPVATIEIGLVEDAIKDLERDATTLKERHEAIQEEYNAAKHDAEEAEAEKVIYIRRLMFG